MFGDSVSPFVTGVEQLFLLESLLALDEKQMCPEVSRCLYEAKSITSLHPISEVLSR